MGKEQLQEKPDSKQKQEAVRQTQQQKIQQTESIQPAPKKKIIKKMMFKANNDKQTDDLKDWKPVKIERKADEQRQSAKQQNIAQLFLSSLSKPASASTQKPNVFYDDQQVVRMPNLKVKQVMKQKPTAEQIKWDIQDQTFIRKEFIPKKQIQQKLQQNPLDNEDQQLMNDPAIQVGGLKTGQQPQKIRHIDLSKVVNSSWKEEVDRKNIKNQLWEGAQGLLDGRGSLAKLARQAQDKAQQIEDELNKRSYEKKQMRSRYGW